MRPRSHRSRYRPSGDCDEQRSIRNRLGWIDSLAGFRSRLTDAVVFADSGDSGTAVRLRYVERAQALGDYRSLVDIGRRVVRVQLDDIESGLRHLFDAMRSALTRGRVT